VDGSVNGRPDLYDMCGKMNTSTGGSIMTTATAMTEAQSVLFCWKKDWTDDATEPVGRHHPDGH
jgi:hypothetical protein